MYLSPPTLLNKDLDLARPSAGFFFAGTEHFGSLCVLETSGRQATAPCLRISRASKAASYYEAIASGDADGEALRTAIERQNS